MLPAASSTASEVKFSLAISSRCRFCRSVSCRTASKITGSTSDKGRDNWSCSVIYYFPFVRFYRPAAGDGPSCGFGRRETDSQRRDVGINMGARQPDLLRFDVERMIGSDGDFHGVE